MALALAACFGVSLVTNPAARAWSSLRELPRAPDTSQLDGTSELQRPRLRYRL